MPMFRGYVVLAYTTRPFHSNSHAEASEKLAEIEHKDLVLIDVEGREVYRYDPDQDRWRLVPDDSDETALPEDAADRGERPDFKTAPYGGPLES